MLLGEGCFLEGSSPKSWKGGLTGLHRLFHRNSKLMDDDGFLHIITVETDVVFLETVRRRVGREDWPDCDDVVHLGRNVKG